MVAFSRQSLMRTLPVYGALCAGLAAAACVAVLPAGTLESLVWTSGVATLIPAAAPPLGSTARALLALGAGMMCAALVWSSLFLLFGAGGVFADTGLASGVERADGTPVLRRADAHPDAPPRRPMSAADLGTPMMEVGRVKADHAKDERAIPADLDLPLAAFDPNAILPVPMEPVRPVPPLVSIPTPISATSPEPARIEPEPASPPSIEALLRRLEQGAVRRQASVR